jgi:hypothetical protein
MKQLIILIGLLISLGCYGQQTNRELKVVTFSGSGYELGHQHGKELKKEIGEVISAWKKGTSSELGKDADTVIKDFFEYAEFDEAIKKWTPELYDEVKGIADGSGQNFHDILVLNLIDEFWVYLDNIDNHHCSALGVPSRNGEPGYIAQNVDIDSFTDGYQLLMRLNRTKDNPEQLILTYPGLIALNGLNEAGIGVCVNTIMELQASSNGLPVAFVIRHILNLTDKEDVLNFIKSVNHGSGQNYIIGIKGEVFDFEASANKVVRYNPTNENGTVYHTNHPIVNDDVKPWYEKYNPNLNDELRLVHEGSYLRFKSVEKRMISTNQVNENLIKEALRSKDDKNNPVCRTYSKDKPVFTFASTIMTHSGKPFLQILAGPPDESEFQRFDFSSK